MRGFGAFLAGIIGLLLFLAGGWCVLALGGRMGSAPPSLVMLTAIGVFGGGGLLYVAYFWLRDR